MSKIINDYKLHLFIAGIILLIMFIVTSLPLKAQDNNKYKGGSYDGYNGTYMLPSPLSIDTSKYSGGSYDGICNDYISIRGIGNWFIDSSRYAGSSYDGYIFSYITATSLGGYRFEKFFGGGCDGAAMGNLSESPLPVLVASFNYAVNKNNVRLSWITEKEESNSGFELQRKKHNTEWLVITFINGNGNSSTPRYYEFTDLKLQTGIYQYRLKQVDYNGTTHYFDLRSMVEIGPPLSFDMGQNYPNPSNPDSKIEYTLPSRGKVEIKLFDAAGREVMRLVNEEKDAGYYFAEFKGSDLSSGVYFYRIKAECSGQNYIKTMKMILVK